MGAPNLTNLQEIFAHHPVETDQAEHYQAIRAGAEQFARIILEHTPHCADQSASIRLVREATMTANASVALRGMI